MEGITLARIAKAIGIKGFIAIGLAVAFGLAVWHIHSLKADLGDAQLALANEKAAHAITRQSVADLESSLAVFVGAGKAARIAQLASIEAQAKRNADLDAEANAIFDEMARLGDTKGGQCKTPKTIIDAKGL